MPKTREQDHRPAGLRAYATTYDGGPAGTDRVMTVNVKPPESRLSKVLALVGWNRERTAPARWMPSDDVDELLAFSEEDAMRIRIRTRARVTLPGAVQTKHRLHGPYRVVTGFLASGGPAGSPRPHARGAARDRDDDLRERRNREDADSAESPNGDVNPTPGEQD